LRNPFQWALGLSGFSLTLSDSLFVSCYDQYLKAARTAGDAKGEQLALNSMGKQQKKSKMGAHSRARIHTHARNTHMHTYHINQALARPHIQSSTPPHTVFVTPAQTHTPARSLSFPLSPSLSLSLWHRHRLLQARGPCGSYRCAHPAKP